MAEYPGARNNPEIVTPEKKMREVVREETAAITAAIRDALLAIPRPEPAVEAPVSIRQEFHGFSTDEVRSLARKGVEEALAAVRQRKRSR